MANAQRKRAFLIVRFIKARKVYVLRNVYGLEFEQAPATLERYGYHPVRSKPRYAE